MTHNKKHVTCRSQTNKTSVFSIILLISGCFTTLSSTTRAQKAIPKNYYRKLGTLINQPHEKNLAIKTEVKKAISETKEECADQLQGAETDFASTAIPDQELKLQGNYSPDHPQMKGAQISYNLIWLAFKPKTTVGTANKVLKQICAKIAGGLPGANKGTEDLPGILFLLLPTKTHEELEKVLAELRSNAAVEEVVQDAALTLPVERTKPSPQPLNPAEEHAKYLEEQAKLVKRAIVNLNDSAPHVRYRASQDLHGKNSEEGNQALRKAALNDPDLDVRKQAVTSLSVNLGQKSFEFLVLILKDPIVEVRRQAAWVLRMLRTKEAAEELINILQTDKDAEMRRRAASILGDMQAEEAVDALIAALKDPELSVRLSAASALGGLRSPKAVQQLEELLVNEQDEWVRNAAEEALNRLRTFKGKAKSLP